MLLYEVERLLSVASSLFTVAFARQRFLGALLFTRFQVKRVPLYFLDDVFGLHLAFEAPERTFQGFSILDVYFSQSYFTYLSKLETKFQDSRRARASPELNTDSA
jgi:hypothetical protein